MQPRISVIIASVTRHRLRALFALAAVVALIAGAGFAAAESDVVSTYWEGLWWALSLMTTVGFVGETPETTSGRILSAVLMVLGFGLMALTTAAIASLFVRSDEAPAEEREAASEDLILQRLDELATKLDRLERASRD